MSFENNLLVANAFYSHLMKVSNSIASVLKAFKITCIGNLPDETSKIN